LAVRVVELEMVEDVIPPTPMIAYLLFLQT
jgi:hypothetical protein